MIKSGYKGETVPGAMSVDSWGDGGGGGISWGGGGTAVSWGGGGGYTAFHRTKVRVEGPSENVQLVLVVGGLMAAGAGVFYMFT